MVPRDTNARRDFSRARSADGHDRAGERDHHGASTNDSDTAGISADGRRGLQSAAQIWSPATRTAPRHLVRGLDPPIPGVDANLADGALDDDVLQVRHHPSTLTTPARPAPCGGAAGALRPESAVGTANCPGDPERPRRPDDLVVHL
jgi:hypothetical protein